jgi:hypothetical protein
MSSPDISKHQGPVGQQYTKEGIMSKMGQKFRPAFEQKAEEMKRVKLS